MNAIELWPEKFKELETKKLTCGWIVKRGNVWKVIEKRPISCEGENDLCIPGTEQILDWFGLPADTEIIIDEI